MDRVLDVYLHESRVGQLTQDESGRLAFAYAADWLADDRAETLSRSLPLQEIPFDHRATRPFFAGLLPEAEKRDRIARSLGVSEKNDFALLDAIGGECAGAVALWPAGERPPPDRPASPAKPLDERDLIEILETLPRRPLLVGKSGQRLSLAGSQDKLPVRFENGRVALTAPGAPSTHIIKPCVPGFEDTVHNEAFCLRLASLAGLQAAEARIHHAGAIPFLLIQRYDREREPSGAYRRLHQEDFCQALGYPPELKYENEGGPSLTRCFDLVRSASSRPVVDLARLLDAVVFHALAGNRDAHGKNYSLLYRSNGSKLTPLYDVTCTVIYPDLSSRLAMKIGGKYELDAVYPRHWERLAEEAGLGPALVRRRVRDLAGELPGLARAVASEMHDEGLDSPVITRLVAAIEAAASIQEDRLASVTP